MLAFAIMLLVAAMGAWIAAGAAARSARAYLRFAAVLEAALAVSAGVPLATPAVAAIVTTLAAGLLAIAAAAALRQRPFLLVASALLIACCVAGIAAAATGVTVLSAVPQVIGVIAIALTARAMRSRRSRLYLGLGALSLAGVAACAQGEGMLAQAGVLLFSAAGLMGVTLASDVLVELRQEHEAALAIGRLR
jgi:hypothetical protein